MEPKVDELGDLYYSLLMLWDFLAGWVLLRHMIRSSTSEFKGLEMLNPINPKP